jgi:hypothetical protein
MEKNPLVTLVELIEKRAVTKGYELELCKASFLECVIQNILESSREPKQVIQSWINNLSE